jgi:hypothetical protein
VEERVYQGFPDSILQQVVSGDYGNGTFQVHRKDRATPPP